jgi:NitT/TauT family transport system substrate-binding protein
VGNPTFVRKNPAATKAVVRAILRATDECAQKPSTAAQYMVDTVGSDYEETLAVLKRVRYDVWRSFDPSDTLRFYALRMHESGDISLTPDQVLKQTNFRFLEDLKREMPRAQSIQSISSELCGVPVGPAKAGSVG